MGNKLICQAFSNAAGSRLNLKSATLRYVHVGPGHDKQVLEFTGTHQDGTDFNVRTDPFEGAPEAQAKETALKLIASHDHP